MSLAQVTNLKPVGFWIVSKFWVVFTNFTRYILNTSKAKSEI